MTELSGAAPERADEPGGTAGPRIQFAIDGMTCAGCTGRVERALAAVAGVRSASVNLALEHAEVVTEVQGPDQEALLQAVADAGYRASPAAASGRSRADAEQAREAERARSERRDRILLLVASALTLPLVAQMVSMALAVPFHLPPVLELALATPVQFWIGARFYRAAWNAVRAGSGNMDLLVAIGTSAAYGYSLVLLLELGAAAQGRLYFEASAVIVTLIFFGKWLETRAKRGTSAAIRELMALRPEVARVERGGLVLEVPAEDIARGDVVLVRPGERLPVDGTVLEGESELDQSLVTGESLPVDRGPGDSVTGGAVNGSGFLKIAATAVGEDSTLSRIIRLVEAAQSGKAPVQRLVDRISAVFVPLVIAIAAVTFAAWLALGGGFENALVAAVSVLVIACPCALGLATPTAMVAGSGAAARAGILIKDFHALEQAHKLGAVIFDKTGTLTQGRPRVTNLVALEGDEARLLQSAAAVQAGSEHPLARATLAAAGSRGLAPATAVEIRSRTGSGVTGRVRGRRLAIGNQALMAAEAVPTEAAAGHLDRFEGEGKTAVMVAEDGRLIGLIAFMDPLRPEAAPGVAALKELGIRTLMLSGDAEKVAAATARRAGIDSFAGAVAPEAKAERIAALQSQGKAVAMVGDGINDAPALARADLSIAMGTGTDVAMETAGLTLMRPDPRLVAAAVDITRSIRSKIRQNLFWAFIFNLIGLPLAAFGLLNPAIAGAAMAMSSVSVVSNSLLLRAWRPRLREVAAAQEPADMMATPSDRKAKAA